MLYIGSHPRRPVCHRRRLCTVRGIAGRRRTSQDVAVDVASLQPTTSPTVIFEAFWRKRSTTRPLVGAMALAALPCSWRNGLEVLPADVESNGFSSVDLYTG